MRYQLLEKPDFAAVRIEFEAAGEQVRVEASAMLAKDNAVELKTQMQGGLLSAAKRKLLGGESFFQNTFTATAPGQSLYLAPGPEGDVEVLNFDGSQTLFLASGAFLAAAPTIQLDTQWNGAKGFFGGAGLFLLRASGVGPLFFSCYGGIHPVDLEGGTYICDTGHILGFTQGLDYRVTKVGGLKSLFLGGEGLVCEFRGTGRLWISTRKASSLAAFLHPFRPVQQNNG